MKDFNKGSVVSYQLKHNFKQEILRYNSYQIRVTCVDTSPFKETVDRAVACGFLTIDNVIISPEQFTEKNNTFLYDLKLTEVGKTYMEYLLL